MEGNGRRVPGEAPRFTVTEGKLLAVLADGLPHRREELRACLPDELGENSNFQRHISNIRKKIRPGGYDILCEFYQKTFCYRHIRLLPSAYQD
jgi:hypothetical protein